MRALRLDDGLRVREVPRPEPAPGEALIRVERSGICNTDLELARGYMRFRGTLGHEFCGVVERAEDPGLAGRRVVGEINVWCGECALCLAGERAHCPNRTVIGILGRDGAHAQYLTLPARNLHRVPEGISPESATLVEPLAACCRILEQRPVERGERVAIVGDGKIAYLAAQVLRTATPEVRVIGKHESKLAAFADLGFETAWAGTGAWTADVVVECSGSPSGFAVAAGIVRPRGTIVLKTTCAVPVPLDTSAIVVNEITVLGSRCGPFERALALLGEGAIEIAPFIEAILPLSRGVEAMERAAAPGARKILLDPRE
jgi:threonine dehydrogenase-like Zn-dependent dehydrogenase